MRSNRKILTGIVVLAAALLAYGVFITLRNTQSPPVVSQAEQAAPLSQPVNVSTGRRAVAAVDIPARSIITPEMLKMVDYTGPQTDVFVTDMASVSGFITRVPIPAGAPLQRENDLVGHISETGIAGALQTGTRAMVVPIINKPALHSLVRIGNFVDVLASFESQEARPIVENVRVLAVDVFGNDYPQVNIAMRGPFKADPKAQGITSTPPAPAAPNAPGAGAGTAPAPLPTPTPTPAPQQAPPRPDPALTLEVTPQQAAAIQLAIQSGAAIDFLVRPALPSNRSAEAVLASDSGAPGATTRTVSVTKAQIAPYAERRKAQNARPAASGGRAASGSGTARPSIPIRDLAPRPSFETPPMPVPNVPVEMNRPASEMAPSAPPAAPRTYDIPIYADGKVVRVETVPKPRD